MLMMEFAGERLERAALTVRLRTVGIIFTLVFARQGKYPFDGEIRHGFGRWARLLDVLTGPMLLLMLLLLYEQVRMQIRVAVVEILEKIVLKKGIEVGGRCGRREKWHSRWGL